MLQKVGTLYTVDGNKSGYNHYYYGEQYGGSLKS